MNHAHSFSWQSVSAPCFGIQDCLGAVCTEQCCFLLAFLLLNGTVALLKRLILPEGYNLSKHPGESFPASLSCIKQGLAISRLNKSTEKQVVALRGFFKACVRKYIMSAELDIPRKELHRLLAWYSHRKSLQDAAKIHFLRILLQELVILVFFCPTSRMQKVLQQSGCGQQQNLLFCPSQKAKVWVWQRRRWLLIQTYCRVIKKKAARPCSLWPKACPSKR